MNKPIHHVLPVNDLVPHTEEGLVCACGPKVEEHEYGFVVIHNSYDGRELLERKPGWLKAPGQVQ